MITILPGAMNLFRVRDEIGISVVWKMSQRFNRTQRPANQILRRDAINRELLEQVKGHSPIFR